MEKDCINTIDSFDFMLSCLESDIESYFDTGSTPACSGNNSSLEANKEPEEFEFGVSGFATNKPDIKENVDNVSPADDLFYRGQLLPLHLPRRLEMVRNLSSSDEGDADGFDTYSLDTFSLASSDADQMCGCAETDEKAHSQRMSKSAKKLKAKAPRFMEKFKSMNDASAPTLTTDYSFKQNLDNPLNSSRTNASTNVKNTVRKYVKLVKHRISSQIGDQQLKNEKGVRPGRADDSGRQKHGGLRPPMNSSVNFCSNDLQSAIAYCKQSSSGMGGKED